MNPLLLVPSTILLQTLLAHCYLTVSPEVNHDSLIYSKYQLVSLTVGQLDKSLNPQVMDSKLGETRGEIPFIEYDFRSEPRRKWEDLRRLRKSQRGLRVRINSRRREDENAKRYENYYYDGHRDEKHREYHSKPYVITSEDNASNEQRSEDMRNMETLK